MFRMGEEGKIELVKRSKHHLGDRVKWRIQSHRTTREGLGTILFSYYTINVNYRTWKNQHFRILGDDGRVRSINSITRLGENIVTEQVQRAHTTELIALAL